MLAFPLTPDEGRLSSWEVQFKDGCLSIGESRTMGSMAFHMNTKGNKVLQVPVSEMISMWK